MSGYLFAAAYAVLACACYGAGRAALPPRWTAAVAVGGLGVSAAQLRGPAAVTGFVSVYLVFVALPLLAGRYVARQRALAGQLRLRERLRIARDMHDSLGRRLSLACVQAAALEVSELPSPQREAVARLATAVRASVTELHEIVDALGHPRARGMAAAGELIGEFRSAGAVVSMRSHGTPVRLPGPTDETAYRVIEEGLTNAIRHAPGQPVTVTVAWEDGQLLLTVVNATDSHACVPGSGLGSLAERLRQAGGYLGHGLSGGLFRLHAVLPTAPAPGTGKRHGVSALGLAVGILLLVILPVTILLGVR